MLVDLQETQTFQPRLPESLLSLVLPSKGRTRMKTPSMTIDPLSVSLLASSTDPRQTSGENHRMILGLFNTVYPCSANFSRSWFPVKLGGTPPRNTFCLSLRNTLRS